MRETLTFDDEKLHMIILKNILPFLLMALLFGSCNHKKKSSLSGNDTVEVKDFIDSFQPIILPCHFSDSILQKKEKDSLLISTNVFAQFVPDSLLHKIFGKGGKTKIYPLGKVEIAKGETYLFTKIKDGGKMVIYILCFDKEKQFMVGMPVLHLDQQPATVQTVAMDNRSTIIKTVLRKNADGSISEGKDVYVWNKDSKNFMLIMTDAVDEKVTDLINPIDTLSKKNKFSADYGTGSTNLVSVRDGRKPDRITFFIHFEKNNGECSGELKGEALLHSSTTAEYRQGGDPCILKFNFTSSSVTITEESCGSRRGLNCSFNVRFQRKRSSLPVNKKTVKK
ncbi:MAG: hypothetical protein ABIU11_07030 [Chitinophagaceae bacterium]